MATEYIKLFLTFDIEEINDKIYFKDSLLFYIHIDLLKDNKNKFTLSNIYCAIQGNYKLNFYNYHSLPAAVPYILINY